MARINSYTEITGAPADSDCFIIDSTQGTAGTRIVLWSVLKSVLTGIFAPKAHKHPGSDITSAVANANAATNDSIGQNIASTYVKSLSVDGRTITVKRGNNTTFTFQTQDTNTTYPPADATHSGIMAASDWNLLHSLKTINRTVELGAGNDLNSYNSVEKCGWYHAGGGNAVANKPSGIDNFGMFVMRIASGVISQILYDNSNRIWTRACLNSSWSPWTALVRTTDTIAKATSATNATNATKATQDSAGQTINTTYVKSVTASGRTVTVTKGNGTISTFTTQDTTYGNMSGATTSAAGRAGLVPAPATGANNRYLRSDGTWAVPPDTNTTYPLASQSVNGLMSSADKRKLDGLSSDVAGSIPLATPSRDGLMAKADKAKLDAAKTINAASNLKSDADFNNIKAAGYYNIHWDESKTMLHKPFTGQSVGILIVFSLYNNNEFVQYYIRDNGYEGVKFRTYNSGNSKTWSEWGVLNGNQSISTGTIDSMFNI